MTNSSTVEYLVYESYIKRNYFVENKYNSGTYLYLVGI